MREVCTKVADLIFGNPARDSCPEAAKILNLSERQFRYALSLLKQEGYKACYVKKKLVLKKCQVSMPSNHKEENIRQFHILCSLSALGPKKAVRRSCTNY